MFTLLLTTMMSISTCQSSPLGIPTNSDENIINICHTGYFTEYSTKYHVPEVTSWVVTDDTATSCKKRSGSFKQDPMANNEDVSPKEYIGSGYDKGHMADAADFTYDDTLENETFYMTNMTPQKPGLNRGGWKWLETSTRYYASKYKKVIVFSGPIFGIEDTKLNSVTVPKYYYKIIYVPSINKSLSIIVENNDINGSDILNDIVSVKTIEEYTNIIFPLPDNYNKNDIESKEDWIPNFKELSNLKKEKCND